MGNPPSRAPYQLIWVSSSCLLLPAGGAPSGDGGGGFLGVVLREDGVLGGRGGDHLRGWLQGGRLHRRVGCKESEKGVTD